MQRNDQLTEKVPWESRLIDQSYWLSLPWKQANLLSYWWNSHPPPPGWGNFQLHAGRIFGHIILILLLLLDRKFEAKVLKISFFKAEQALRYISIEIVVWPTRDAMGHHEFDRRSMMSTWHFLQEFIYMAFSWFNINKQTYFLGLIVN